MKYCFVAGNYPTEERQVHVFLENLVVNLVDKGEGCSVIAPQSYVAYYVKKGIRREVVSERITSNGNKYMVYSPIYFVLPKLKIGELSTLDLQRNIIYKTLKRTYKKYNIEADLIYSHFIRIGMSGVRLAKELGVPSFIANGEADTLGEIRMNSKRIIEKTLKDVTGIISVSTKNKNEIIRISGSDTKIHEKISIIVNAADNNRFYPKDKIQIRKKMGWPIDAFIVVFTGSFIGRKGVVKLSKAIAKFDDVYSVFIGVGEQKPTCKNILYCGRVNNIEMNDYLNSADIFVLPTQAEGCSNAIVEAVLCGLPVVSSDKEFNYDILDDTCSILINPNSEAEIYNAILKLKENNLYREKLRCGAIERSKQLNLECRVKKIQAYIKSKINEFKV